MEKQCRLLEAQRAALQTIKQRAHARAQRGNSESDNHGRAKRERAQIEYESNELAESLQDKFRTAIKQSETISASHQPNVERILEKDDRLLDGLEKVLPHITSDGTGIEDSAEIERLCQTLKLLTTADIRARIDAAYLDGAHEHASHANSVNGKASREAAQLTSLHAELDELCREIDGLSAMAVDNQHRTPILHATRAAAADAAAERAAWATYLHSALQHATARLDHLLEQLEDQRAHAGAAKAMSAALEEVLAAGAEKADLPARGARSPAKAAQKGLKPLRLVQANLSDAQDPAAQLMRQLDVRVAGEMDASALSVAAAEKIEKLRALRANTERSISDLVAQSLADADVDVQDLLGAVFAHSEYGTVHLESEAVRNGITGLETKTQELSEKMRNLDVDGITRTTKAKQGELLEQLSSR